MSLKEENTTNSCQLAQVKPSYIEMNRSCTFDRTGERCLKIAEWVRINILLITMLFFSSALFAQNNNEEFRSTWVIDSHWLTVGNTVAENQAQIREVLDNHKAANMTSVLLQVRRFGTVYYPSAIEPWGPLVDFTDPGFDPLEYAVQEAHARGLELHAWMNTFESRHQYAGSPSQLHPEWICRDQDGIIMPPELAWLSPGIPEARDHILSVAMEIVNNYDVDGLHMDFVRWSEYTNTGKTFEMLQDNIAAGLPDGMISDAQAEELVKNPAGRYLYDLENPASGGVPLGYFTWEDFWRGSVTELVAAIHDSIAVVKPWVRLSPAALGRYNWGGWQGYNIVYQDAAGWLNNGHIDQVVGMHYHWNTAAAIYDVLEGGCPSCWSDFMQPAIAAGRLYTVGLFSDRFATDNVFGRHESIIDTVRSVDWAHGVQFFSYDSWRDLQYWDQAREDFFTSKTRITATGLVDDIAPAAPTISLTKLDSFAYRITVTPVSSDPEDRWFAIYRSEDDVADLDSDEIIETAFREVTFAYTDRFDGTQDYNGSYYYYATALDRYWNESLASDLLVSAPIPSFAPVILSSSPVDGDSIPVNGTIELVFSKTMDPANLASALSFQPAVTLGTLAWAEDNNSVVINFGSDLNFASDYVMTLDASLTDVNGRALDGNGDGVEGDPFVLNFSTLEMDVSGPLIASNWPLAGATEFLIDDLITFEFDETVDVATIDDSSIELQEDGNDIPFSWRLNTRDERSILSVQPNNALGQELTYTLALSSDIADTLGNLLAETVSYGFTTSKFAYSENITIEDFSGPGDWWQPDASGSTVGILVAGTQFDFTTSVVLPASQPQDAASLSYAWDTASSEWLLREYLAGGVPRDVQFDSSYTLQCYVFGDGSNTQFRFAVDDNVPSIGANNHEVSAWIDIDWVGWRLVEWDMGDPGSYGTWLGDGAATGSLRFDSYQLAYLPDASAESGQIWFDELRLVKKSSAPLAIGSETAGIPEQFQLYQNFPNPFNPRTTIAYDLPSAGEVQLVIYDMLGREVQTLVKGKKAAGHYEVEFDAQHLPSGIYIYRLAFNKQSLAKRLLLVK